METCSLCDYCHASIYLLKAATDVSAQKYVLCQYWYDIQSCKGWYGRGLTSAALFSSSYSGCYCQLHIDLKAALGLTPPFLIMWGENKDMAEFKEINYAGNE